MIKIENVYVQKEIFEANFNCHYTKCKSKCCRGGKGVGAPLERKEVIIWEDLINSSKDLLKSYLSEEKIFKIEKNFGIKEINNVFYTDIDSAGDCVFLGFINNEPRCILEYLYNQGKIEFNKPISCSLFPLRVYKYLGNKLYLKLIVYDECKYSFANSSIKLIDFLKKPIIERFGKEWYNSLKEYQTNYEAAQEFIKH